MWKYLFCLAFLAAGCSCEFAWRHHNNQELLVELEKVHMACRNITRVYTLSEPSVRGIPLYVIEFSEHPGHHVPMHPEFKYIGNIHGNEVLGRELLLGLAHDMCDRYNSGDLKIRRLIGTTRIHILPCMNPDGWQLATDTGGTDYLIGRNNNHSIDLNRNFPDLDHIIFYYERVDNNHNNHLLAELDRLSEPLEPETRSVVRWIMSVPFVLSGALHGGDLVANYPYDASRSGRDSDEYSPTPDDDTFRSLAVSYASAHADMGSPFRSGCPLPQAAKNAFYAETVPYNFGKQGGVTNGAQWYSLHGGMQDFNYLASNCFEITLELGCEKYPPNNVLEQEWFRNRKSLYDFMWRVHSGIRGFVRDQHGSPISNAIIRVRNITKDFSSKQIAHDVTSGLAGAYYRLLTPGVYWVTALRQGYAPRTLQVAVPEDDFKGQTTQVDFKLYKLQRAVPGAGFYPEWADNDVATQHERARYRPVGSGAV